VSSLPFSLEKELIIFGGMVLESWEAQQLGRGAAGQRGSNAAGKLEG